MLKFLLIPIAFLILISKSYANKIVMDEHGLAKTELATEMVGPQRAQLLARFHSLQPEGRIACELSVDIKSDISLAIEANLQKVITLLPREVIPVNLGLFPVQFRASSNNLSGKLVCNKLTLKSKLNEKKLVSANKETVKNKKSNSVGFTKTCCKLSPFRIHCHHEGPSSVDIDKDEDLETEYDIPANTSSDTSDIPSCWPDVKEEKANQIKK